MDANSLKRNTVLAQLKAIQNDTLGYIQYIFENLEEKSIWSKYIWCVRFPNWQCRDIQIDDIGYLTYELHNAGVDKWYDGDKFIPYKYSGYQFLNFIDKPIKIDKNETIILQKIMTVMADAFAKALDEKKNDVKNFVWKGEKKLVNGEFVQDEIQMMDATQEQLQNMYNRCVIMLDNPSPKNPGRNVLIKQIGEQVENCNAELFLRYIEKGNPDKGIKPIPRFSYFQSLKAFLDNNEEAIPRETWSKEYITRITNVPEDFSKLTIEKVYCACIDSLGSFDKKHLTSNFITSLGLWFTDKELLDLTEHNEKGELINRLKVVKTRLNLKPYVKLHIKNGGLTYREFRAMMTLSNKKYSELTTDQLMILRNTILHKLEAKVRDHAKQWNERIQQILKVCETRNITINTDVSNILFKHK